MQHVTKYLRKKKKNGFTMIELLVVVVIVGTLSTAGVVGLQMSQSRARDANRKSDLEKIKVAFEDYYNDNNCYPPSTSLDSCGSAEMRPYLDRVPCDPRSEAPYLYVPLSNACSGYRLHAALESVDEADLEDLGCTVEVGCGYSPDYNYGIAAGATVFDPEGEPLPEPTSSAEPSAAPSSPQASPSPSGPVYVYACDSAGTCNRFEEGHPTLLTCPVTFPQSNCNNECGNPVFHCGG